MWSRIIYNEFTIPIYFCINSKILTNLPKYVYKLFKFSFNVFDNLFGFYIHIWKMIFQCPYEHAKRPWWWILQFNPCPNILDDVDWDCIIVQAYLMIILEGLINVQVSLMMIIGIQSMSQNQFSVKITKIWSRWQLELVAQPIFGKNFQNLVTMIIRIGCTTNFW